MAESKALNLQQKMLLVSTEVMNVEKNMTIAAGTKSSYKAVADYDVVVAVKKAEAKYGIISVPVEQKLIDSRIQESTDSYGNRKSVFIDVVEMTMLIYDADNPEDRITVTAYGRGIDSGDKGFGKASTYARKYCLLNAYKIATGEDPDKDASTEVHYTTPSNPAPTPEPTPAPATTTKLKLTQKAAEAIAKALADAPEDDFKKLETEAKNKYEISDDQWKRIKERAETIFATGK